MLTFNHLPSTASLLKQRRLQKCNAVYAYSYPTMILKQCDTLFIWLHINAGVDDNETIKVYRSGGADPDTRQPGDLFVTIKVTFL